ncbi:hypothetical protein [Ligilactobacillus ruminis]|uniref:hypothetical protein n=1 Tax=Ligilactobacillus ruminis TaxID=1623 RepID=UPI0022E9050B|nr:hypothetical protein [Ligilactobacillus ruminis]
MRWQISDQTSKIAQEEAGEKNYAQIENPDDLQLIANHPGFCIFMTIACYDANSRK